MSAIYARNNVRTVGAIMRVNTFSFRSRIMHSENPILQNIVKSIHFRFGDLSERWNSILYVSK